MKRIVTTFALLALLLGAGQLTAQTPRYKVVFIGTFGGPNSHFSIGGTRILNNDGSFVGWADDSLLDPFAPDGCWDGDCFVARAFLQKNGEMADLGALAPGFSSDVSWMSSSGLISVKRRPARLTQMSGGRCTASSGRMGR